MAVIVVVPARAGSALAVPKAYADSEHLRLNTTGSFLGDMGRCRYLLGDCQKWHRRKSRTSTAASVRGIAPYRDEAALARRPSPEWGIARCIEGGFPPARATFRALGEATWVAPATRKSVPSKGIDHIQQADILRVADTSPIWGGAGLCLVEKSRFKCAR